MNEVPIAISNPRVSSLLVKPLQNEHYRRSSWFKVEPFATYGIAGDTALIGNVKIRLKKSPTDSFQVTIIKVANGESRGDADALATLIPFSLVQKDSILLMDKAITINKTDKFRNQQVEVIIYVPVGHRIKIEKSFGYRNRVTLDGYSRNRNWFNYQDDKDFTFNYGIDYIMREDGLYTLTGAPSSYKNRIDDGKEDWNSENGNNYRYNGNNFDSLKIEQQKQLDKMERALDSTKEVQRNEMERLKDSLRKAKEEIDERIEKLNTASFSSMKEEDDYIIPMNPFIMHI